MPQTVLEVQPPRSTDFNSLDLYQCWHLKPLGYSDQIEN
jgi:hypothetical protein